MRKVTYLMLFTVIVTFNGLNAQETASASTTTTVVAPIAITKSADMSFGNVAVSSNTAGTVVLAPAGTRTVTGGATIPATTGTVSAASFDITGESGYTYSITLPSSGISLSDGGVNTVTVDTFTSSPSGTGTLTAGAETVNVGATLNLAAGQVSGTYSNASDLTVTVNYN